MNLFYLSALALLINVTCSAFSFGFAIDIISPLIVAVALTRPIKTIVWWSIIMGTLWAPFFNIIGYHLPLAWIISALITRQVTKGLEWENKNVLALITIIFSACWHMQLYLFQILAVGIPRSTFEFWGTMIIRPLSAGIIVIIFKRTLFGYKKVPNLYRWY